MTLLPQIEPTLERGKWYVGEETLHSCLLHMELAFISIYLYFSKLKIMKHGLFRATSCMYKF